MNPLVRMSEGERRIRLCLLGVIVVTDLRQIHETPQTAHRAAWRAESPQGDGKPVSAVSLRPSVTHEPCVLVMEDARRRAADIRGGVAVAAPRCVPPLLRRCKFPCSEKAGF